MIKTFRRLSHCELELFSFASPEPALKVSPRHRVCQELSEGKSDNISCRIEGDVTSYRWVLPNDKPLSSRVRAFGNMLTISPVLRDDAGMYLCVAQGGSDSNQVVEARVNVTIQSTYTSTVNYKYFSLIRNGQPFQSSWLKIVIAHAILVLVVQRDSKLESLLFCCFVIVVVVSLFYIYFLL